MKDYVKYLEAVIFPKLKEIWPQVFGHVVVVHADRWLAVYVKVASPSFPVSSFSAVVRKVDELVNTTEFNGQICRFEGGGSVLRSVGDGYCHYYQFWLPIVPLTREDFRKFFPQQTSPP